MPGARARTETFLFSDIEGSTRMLRRLGDAYPPVLERHREVMRAAFAAHRGAEQGTEGDSFFVVFEVASDAIAAAVDAQLGLAQWEAEGGDAVRVRIGIHTGEALLAAGGYVGLAVHEAGRISGVGHGGQIVVSEATRLVAEDLPPAITFTDLGEHRLKDFERPVRLFQVGHAGLAAVFPPLRSLAMLPNNLPKPFTSFVGRVDEIAAVAALLPTTRVLTLTGPGGIGKTRLGSELASAVAEEYPGGVWFAGLASLDDSTGVAGAVAAAVGLRDDPDRSPTAVLAEWIGSGRVLLVLDNCEHVLDGCADLVNALLPACPALTVLATSRERLAIDGERAWPVPPLSVTAPSELGAVDSDTARLFLDRARAVRPGFSLSERDGPTLASICERLEGIPLAVELAAARVGALSLDELAARLDDRFRLLAGSRRGGPERHQTLHAVVDWSYDLLGDTERLLLRRLGVLTGSFTLVAAEAVAAGPGLAATDVVDVLARLVDRSLVIFGDSAGAPYRMLDTLRDYALERLAEAGEAAATEQRHLRWCVRLAEEAATQLQGPEQAHWLDVLAANHDAIRAALTTGLRGRAHRRAAQLAAAMGRFWLVRGHWHEGRAWLSRTLARPTDAAVRARLLTAAAALAAVQGDDDESRTMAREALPIAADSGDRRTEAQAHFVLGVDAWSRRELDDAATAFGRAQTLSEDAGDQPAAAAAIAGLGTVAWARSDFPEARRLFEHSLAVRQRAGDEHGVAVSLNNLAVLALAEGDHDRVRSLSEESLRISRALEDTEGIAAALHHLAEAAEAQGDVDAAVALAQESLSLGRQLGDRRGMELAEETLGRLGR